MYGLWSARCAGSEGYAVENELMSLGVDELLNGLLVGLKVK